MAEATDAPKQKTINLTEPETKMLLSIIKNLTCDITFDLNAVAEECNYKSGKTVRDMWGRLKKNKLGVTSSATPKKATPGKKREGEEEADDDAENAKVDTPTPSKKARKPKAKSEPKVKEEEMEDAGEDVGGEDFGADGEE